MKKINVFIVDDHEMFREGVKMLLSKSEEFEVIGEARNGKECIENIPAETDIILMDISMPEMNGIEATQQLTTKAPGSRIIALSMFGEEEYYYKMIHAGVCGFVLKEAGSKEMEDAIRIVYGGGNFFSRELLRNVVIGLKTKSPEPEISRNKIADFSDAETKILTELCKGYSDEEIATDLAITTEMVDSYKTDLFKKTETNDTISLIMHSIRNNFVSFSD